MRRTWFFFGAALMWPALALADPCKAIPDGGPLPAFLARGAIFSGPVAYVGDGDSLCVAVGAGQLAWVEVRLEDFYAPELQAPGGRDAKAVLERLAMGRRARCRADHRSYDRVVARCEVGGKSLGDLMRAARRGGGRERSVAAPARRIRQGSARIHTWFSTSAATRTLSCGRKRP